MEVPELAKIAYMRVQRMEPANVGKIFGVMLLREPDKDEMAQLAYGSDAALLSRIDKAKVVFAAITARLSAHGLAPPVYERPLVPATVRQYSPTSASFGFQVPSPYWQDPLPMPPHAIADAAESPYSLLDRHVLDGNLGGYYYPACEDGFHNNVPAVGRGSGTPARAMGRRSKGLPSRQPCHYFFNGICKNGQNCHYAHHQAFQDALALHDDVHHTGATPGSLETLELEIAELLHSRRGQPVSIASLPTIYGEKYGKGIHVDGYLTESQRHGKTGYNLTKLLSRLNKIKIIERPHGQHSVVLAEDAAKYTGFRDDTAAAGDDASSVTASSHQIYLTFPAESTFSEEDVANYFELFGTVRDVRIPFQERRMFGFVSFLSSETVTAVLRQRNPHFICGARVLVKPYKEKSKCIDRTCVDKPKLMAPYCSPRFLQIDQELYPECDTSRLMRRQLAAESCGRLQLDLEMRRRLAVHSLETFPPPPFAYFDCSIEDARPGLHCHLPEDSNQLDLMNPSMLFPGPVEIVSTSQAPPTQAGNNYDDDVSNQIELLPDSPFASSSPDAGDSISAII
ncbi:hypothetical protein GUJ93_ZPchr0013g35138 [Zizania palustris]|uniref:Zinc finger CCCH domain-containing protein 18 n=1 Tax=Zizania palustris TaxID=103762 RepID=A0A8J5X131_ZIZPA|nr:hypothetical protein GUJ93_ZPchr0013g35138 [Zizania palustris]